MKVVIDTRTGEIIDELGEGDRIRKKTQDEYMKEMEDKVEINKGKLFIKLYADTATMLSKEKLTANEYTICIAMLEYINYTSGVLRDKESGRTLGLSDIAEKTGISKSGTIRAMETLVKKKIFGLHKTGRNNCYTVNPYIFMKGRYINKTLQTFYKNSKWAKK